MPVPRLTIDNCACFIIDVQERLLPDIHEHERFVAGCSFMTKVANILQLPTVMTEQVTRVFGPTHADVKDHLPTGTPVFEKSRFSGCIDPVAAWLDETDRPNIIVWGIEAHICVLQTTLDLLNSGRQVFVVTDAISAGEPDQIPTAFRRMEQAGAVLTGCVSAAYELMGDGKHERFKDCLQHVKQLRG